MNDETHFIIVVSNKNMFTIILNEETMHVFSWFPIVSKWTLCAMFHSFRSFSTVVFSGERGANIGMVRDIVVSKTN